MKVTRVAFSDGLNPGKHAVLVEQAARLGRVRSEVWQRYGSIGGVGLQDRQIRDGWLREGTHEQFGVLANAWKETVRDAMADIALRREAAKVQVRRTVGRTSDAAERKRLFTLLKRDEWPADPYLSRLMRQHWRRGRNHVSNQIVVRADHHTVRADRRGVLWLAVPGLEPRRTVRIPLNTTVAPTGTLRLILRGGRVEVHYQIDAASMPSSQRPAGTSIIGVDKGYTEVLTDSDGDRYGADLGALLTAESDRVKQRNQRRAKLRSVANTAARRGDHAKAARIQRHNLGTVKRDRQAVRWKAQVRTTTFTAAHEVADKAAVIVAEDLTKTFTGRKRLGKNANRRLAAWTKGVTAEALHSVSERRGSTFVLVNAAYTSQVCPDCGFLADRNGDRLHCTQCGVVWAADHAAAINILQRNGDPDITLFTPYREVKRIVQNRTDRHRTRLPVQDSNRATSGGERNIPTMLNNER